MAHLHAKSGSLQGCLWTNLGETKDEKYKISKIK